MISALLIENYRGFEKFSMDEVKRINLIVGGNNIGKTSVLEAIMLVISNGDPLTIWKIVSGRGEMVNYGGIQQGVIQPEISVRHLFHSHEVKLGSAFKISATMTQTNETVEVDFKIIEAKPEDNKILYASLPSDVMDTFGPKIALSITGPDKKTLLLPIPLSPQGTLKQHTLQTLVNMNFKQFLSESGQAVFQYIPTTSLTGQELISMWNSVALTTEEKYVVEALRSLDDKIEQVAAISSPVIFPQFGQKTGFIVKMRDLERPVPIGSLGEGTWRMLVLAIALVKSKDAILLIDEIDIGLHFSALSSMWKMIISASSRLNIQVFATTHNNDCIKALAMLKESEISIQRIESFDGTAVNYSSDEIEIATTRNIEIR